MTAYPTPAHAIALAYSARAQLAPDPTWHAKIAQLGPCWEARAWIETQPSLGAAWISCPRADWLLWLAGRACKTDADRRRVVMAACACARLSLRYVPAGEDRPRIAIETAERWCRGEATIEDVRNARGGAHEAASAAAVAYAAAADADASAASAAYAAVSAAYAAAYAAYAPAAEGGYAYAYSAEASAIVRRIVPCPVVGDPETR